MTAATRELARPRPRRPALIGRWERSAALEARLAKERFGDPVVADAILRLAERLQHGRCLAEHRAVDLRSELDVSRTGLPFVSDPMPRSDGGCATTCRPPGHRANADAARTGSMAPGGPHGLEA